MFTQSHTARTCLWCNTPFEGRIDKKFCKSGCKASYSRHALAAEPSLSVRTASRPTSPTRPLPLSGIDWQSRCEQAEEALQAYQQRDEQAKQATARFDQEYARLDQLLKYNISQGWTVGSISYVLPHLQAGIDLYERHPELRNPQHAASHRLNNLCLMEHFLRSEYKRLCDREKDR